MMEMNIAGPHRLTRTAVTFLVLIVIGYVLSALLGLQAHQDPAEMDTVGYLGAAYELGQNGGILGFIPNCLSGAYREATRHPLYLLLLSVFAKTHIDFFVHAKLLTAGIGLVFVLVFFEIVRRLQGILAAGLTLFLVLFNATFIRLTTMVAVESLFALFFILFWFLTLAGFHNPKRWVWAGGAAGLAFMSKSLGILLIPVFLLTAGWVERRKLTELLRNKYFWGFFIAFIVVASPLFIRNAKVYGTPLYSDSSAVMWLDDWHDYGRKRPDGRKPSLGLYLKEHTPGEVLRVMGRGLLIRNAKMLTDGLKPFRFWHNELDLRPLTGFHNKTVSWQGLWAILLLSSACWGLYRAGGPERTLSLLTLSVLLIFVGWYSKVFPHTPPTRLLYPILFLILFYAVCGWQAWSRLLQKKIGFSKPIFLPFLVGGLLIGYSACLLLNFNWSQLNIKKSYNLGPIFSLQLQWVVRNAKPDEKVLVGDAFAGRAFYLKPVLKAETLAWPKLNNMAELESYLRENKFRYGILDLATVVYNQQVFSDYFDVGPEIGIRSKKALPDFFRKIPKDPRIPPLYELYEFNLD